MGRKPNALILEFFERGAKLNDNSNRYRHRCKACGEDFPKGRIDSLTAHLTKKCPAISETDRINACLALHGFNNASSRHGFDGLVHSSPNTGPTAAVVPMPGPTAAGPAAGSATNSPIAQAQNPIWTPLETLAEVSRQIEANEKHEDPMPPVHESVDETMQTSLATPGPVTTNATPSELHEQFTLEHPPMNTENAPQDVDTPQNSPQKLTAEERLQRLLQHAGPAIPGQSALSVAAAAAARLNPSLLDPQLDDEPITEPASQSQPQPQPDSTDMMVDYPSPKPPVPAEPATPWDSMAYIQDGIYAPATVNSHSQHSAPVLNKGGFRMDTSNGPNGPRHRHGRARFDSSRRKEVQEVRRIGACIRCRILRKTCSKGTPCDTCKKVLSPRVWRTGCVRTKLSEYIDLYSAGVQVVMAQKRINNYKTTHRLKNTGILVEASHFPDTAFKVVFEVVQGAPKEVENDLPNDSNNNGPQNPGPVILLDNNKEDIPSKVEQYMRQVLPELIRREPSHYVRLTLEVAVSVVKDNNDELLQRSLELWGIVEMMDRERQWTMLAKSPEEGVKDYWISDESDSEAYTNICMQLTAAAERKASTASKNLLNGIQRNLQDGKTKLGFPMFLTVMLFLNCMEKTTWAFKAWDEENLRPKWPLEKPPSNFTNQGQGLTELLRMLLVIRHILPKTTAAHPDAPIVADEDDPTIQDYFRHLNITPAYLRARHEQNNFQPTDSRSLEFLFCAPLLLN
ncbi:hypothetical protein GGS23DRAFT_557546 [Durotheca rogersii]|uniref:uncharacterized protein n=1 Tax=Durotheca rogersii TaxID=419775 RepID=UPI002220C488|nr:uncharacterized protein GGS23DRAFT_557546 [Durotheca rogersii]KAI5865070.1 hypothetical protein GGS23DRAFT_557546 [Durotheca rogersii]